MSPLRFVAALAVVLGWSILDAHPAAVPAGRPARRPHSAGIDAYGDPLPPGVIARLGTERLRHEGNATGVAFSPDGKRLAARCRSGLILWDLASGKERWRTPASARFGYGDNDLLAFSEDGRSITSVAYSGALLLQQWDASSGQLRREVHIEADQSAPDGRYALSPGGTMLVRPAGPGTFHVVNTATGHVVQRLVRQGNLIFGMPAAVCFSPEGRFVALANPNVQVWDIVTGNLVREMGAAQEFANAIAYSPDGRTLAWSVGPTITLADPATGKEIGRLTHGQRENIIGLRFTPDGRSLAAIDTDDGKLHVWDVATRKKRWSGDSRLWVAFSLAISADSRQIAVAGAYNTIRLWDVATGKPVPLAVGGHDGWVGALAFSPDGRCLATGGVGRQTRLWDTRTWKETRFWPHTSQLVAFKDNGRQLVSVNYRDSAEVWDTRTGATIATLKLPNTLQIQGAALGPNGQLYLAVPNADGTDGELLSWDLSKPASTTDRKPTGPVHEMALSPDGGSFIIRQRRGALVRRDVRTGRERVISEPDQSWACTMVLSPDGSMALCDWPTAAGPTLRLVELVTGKPALTLDVTTRTVATLNQDGGRYSMPGVLSADGRLLAIVEEPSETASPGRRSIRVLSAADGSELTRLSGHNTAVMSLLFSANGKQLVTGMRNGTVLVWDTTAAAEAGRPGARVLSAAQLQALCSDLKRDDAARAYRATWKLADAPTSAVAFLRDKLAPAPASETAHVRALVAELDDRSYPRRESATRELARLGPVARLTLQSLLTEKLSDEARRRIESLLAGQVPPSADATRRLRAILALERAGTPDARAVLRHLTTGAPAAPETQAAQAALSRLRQRSPLEFRL